MEKQYDYAFDMTSSGRPWMVVPKVFTDSRGTFSEVLVDKDGLSSIKQVNRSTSCSLTLRGFHAQRAPYCQAKLVESLTVPLYDIIVDARPDSSSFGLCKAYLLDPVKQNKLFVPRGFLHAFFVPDNDSNADAVFMYYCDNVYNFESQVGVDPKSVVAEMSHAFEGAVEENEDATYQAWKLLKSTKDLVLSKKDLEGLDYQEFMSKAKEDYEASRKAWYID